MKEMPNFNSGIKTLASFAGVLLAFVIIGCGSGENGSAPVKTDTPVAVQQIPSSQDVARQLSGVNFVPKHIGVNMWGMTSGGTFWIGNEKFAVNTFTSTEARDNWLKISKKLGVNPKWMTKTAVVYPSIAGKSS
jgi:hypothetical protein